MIEDTVIEVAVRVPVACVRLLIVLPVITWKTVEVVDRAEVFRISIFAVEAKRLQEVIDEARSEDTKSCRVLKRVAFTDI